MTQMVLPQSQSKIEKAFVDFHTKHPEVYYELVNMALDLKAGGHEKCGIGMLYEVLRWKTMLGAFKADGEAFKLNNNYRAYYARLIMDREPALKGFFNTRELGVPHHVV